MRLGVAAANCVAAVNCAHARPTARRTRGVRQAVLPSFTDRLPCQSPVVFGDGEGCWEWGAAGSGGPLGGLKAIP